MRAVVCQRGELEVTERTAYGIVADPGGRVWFESAPGRGSVFSFTIAVAPDLRYDPVDAEQ